MTEEKKQDIVFHEMDLPLQGIHNAPQVDPTAADLKTCQWVVVAVDRRKAIAPQQLIEIIQVLKAIGFPEQAPFTPCLPQNATQSQRFPAKIAMIEIEIKQRSSQIFWCQ